MYFFLALEIPDSPNYPLNKDFLDIMTEEDSLDTLKDIDKFISKHTTEEILESVKRSNVVLSKPIEESRLIIIYPQNDKDRILVAHPKDDIDYNSFELTEFIYKNVNNKGIRNQIRDHFNKSYIPEDLRNFTEEYAKENDSAIRFITDHFKTLNGLSYFSERLLKDYAYEIEKKQEEKRKLKLQTN